MKNKSPNWLQKYQASIFLVIGVLIGFLLIELFFWIQDHGFDLQLIPSLNSASNIPISVLPGPCRENKIKFRLNPDQVVKLAGMNDFKNERWCDIAGNNYSGKFISKFRYDGTNTTVNIYVQEKSDTLRGRLEAKGLKPNFAYQIKLRGNYKNFKCFEKIGYAGRWRFPGKGTNYTDVEYRKRKDKSDVESYLFFDFFVTDKNGNAVRNFALDSSLHVLWNATRQHSISNENDIFPVTVDASDPETYSRPKNNRNIELIWAEREKRRYSSPEQKRFLSPGKYAVELVLTEESFHSMENDGGYWATVFKGKINFEVE
jgi:hypothetical protein